MNASLAHDRDENAAGIGEAKSDFPYTASDVIRVSDHLSRLDHFGANDVMIKRISKAVLEDRPLTEGQANFM